MDEQAMSMWVTVLGLIPLCLLLASAVTHASHPRAFRDALLKQGISARLSGPLVIAVMTTEGALGAFGLFSALNHSEWPLRLILLSAAVVFGAYAVYSARLLLRGSGAPCGCTVRPSRVSIWVVARAGILSAFALSALPVAEHVLASRSAPFGLLTVLSIIGLGVPLWVLPDALETSSPDASPAPIGEG